MEFALAADGSAPPSQNKMDGKEVRRALPVEVRKAIPVAKRIPDAPVQELTPTPAPDITPTPGPTPAPQSPSTKEHTDLRLHKAYNKEPRFPLSESITLKQFLIRYHAPGIVILAAWLAFNSIRRMLKIARGELSMGDLSLKDIEASRGLDMSSAFGNPARLLLVKGLHVHPAGQFLQRWLVYFPLAWIANIFSPLTWIFALPPAILFRLLER